MNIDQSVKARLDQWETRSVKIGRGVRQRRCLSSILFNFYSEYLPRKTLKVWRLQSKETSNSHCEMRKDYVLVAKEETGPEGVVDRIIEIGIFCESKY